MLLYLVLSTCTAPGPAIVKFPQIKNMLAAGSAAGLSAASVYTETFMYCCNVAYFVRKDLADNGTIDNFQEYGENVNLTLQNLIIIALMWRSALFDAFIPTSICPLIQGYYVTNSLRTCTSKIYLLERLGLALLS